MSIRSTSQVSAARKPQQSRRPRADADGPSFTEVIHSRLFSNYETPRGEEQRSA